MSIAVNEWVSMPQYGGLEYFYSPPSAHEDHDDGVVKLRKGATQKTKRRVPEVIVAQGLGEVSDFVWSLCRQFNLTREYNEVVGRTMGYEF
jgi:hypothetical protein